MEQLAAIKVHEFMVRCQQSGWSVGLAESCTGGLLSSWLTLTPGVSAIYKGAVVSYAASVKVQLLGVSWTAIKSCGEVSLPVARQMAQGARRALACDWSVAITGIAGPSGGTSDKPVGTVCFAVSGPGVELQTQQLMQGAGRQEIQRAAALFAFDFLLSAMR